MTVGKCDFTAIQRQLGELVDQMQEVSESTSNENKNNSLGKARGRSFNRGAGSQTSMVSNIHTSIQQISNYGCWCYFQEAHGNGRGAPVDDVDQYCQYLHHGYECAMIDAEIEGKECVPWKQGYNSSVILGNTQEQLNVECEAKNQGNNCAIRACLVESYFVLNIFGAFLSGVNAPKTIYKHENGFNTSMECPTLPAVEYEFEKRCCGVYPKTISPYRHSGNRECCGGLRTYNPNLYQCCDSEENEEVRVSVVC